MAGKYQGLLNSYYLKNKIYPESFNCVYQNICRMSAHNGNMTETKMSMVGGQYGEKFPKIVVISLDPPSGENKEGETKRWEFKTPTQRTTGFVSSTHEKDDYDFDHPNAHWSMTQIIVKDLLVLWGYKSRPNTAIATESFVGRPIENVSSYFVHINMAKCSMNKPDQGKAPESVHKRCSGAYLAEELALLEPDIIVSQGGTTNRLLGKMFIGRAILTRDLPLVERIILNNRSPIWMPMIHPTMHFAEVRTSWPMYIYKIKKLM